LASILTRIGAVAAGTLACDFITLAAYPPDFDIVYGGNAAQAAPKTGPGALLGRLCRKGHSILGGIRRFQPPCAQRVSSGGLRMVKFVPMPIRPAAENDDKALWAILEPAFRAGETYPIPRDVSFETALAYWRAPGHAVFVFEEGAELLGTYYLRANQLGGGGHVANCGYITAPAARGKGIARAMCEDSVARAREMGFRAMQFNFVVSTNEDAVHLWQRCGFEIVGRVPGAFEHPSRGFVDALVMFRKI
jgi:ribosomal protein S18 acetylase RimI-like enzyme